MWSCSSLQYPPPSPPPPSNTVEQGEWLVYTAYVAEGGFWDVMASVASGDEASANRFRILANATNCSSVNTDGWNGIGDGVDLLNGPATFGFTGSWETFKYEGAEDVWVPAGTHRILFCADSANFNLNYLRVYIPVPTPAPTIAPTNMPTRAPTGPKDDGSRYTWIYVSVSFESCDMGRAVYR